MPELPEVETIARQLSAKVRGKSIVAVEQGKRNQEEISLASEKNFPLRIRHIYRRGKALVFHGGEYSIVAWLGMTGSFQYKRSPSQQSAGQHKHLRATFHLNDGSALYFQDMRKFGSIQLLLTSKLEGKLSSLGPEPLAKSFTLNSFYQLLQQHGKAMIKPALMNQQIIAGIGNIYAQESLYRAGIRPRRKIKTLSSGEIMVLHTQLRKTLRQAIKHGGTTVSDYRHMEGEGSFQNFLRVYGKIYCPEKHALTKIKLGGRGTSYCRRCQR